MNRDLVLRAEGARHPIRRAVPAAALRLVVDTPDSAAWNGEDVRLFLLSFTAFFVAFGVYLF